MRPWFIASTLIIFGITSLVMWLWWRAVAARQVRRLDPWYEWSVEQRVACLRDLKIEQILWTVRLWRAMSVFIVMMMWFVPVSLYLQDSQNDKQAAHNCEVRNAAEEANRQAAMRDVAATSRFLLRMGVDQGSVDGLSADRLTAIPEPEDTDRDCNHNGHLDPGDYPAD